MILFIYGTRPELIKLAPIAAECQRRKLSVGAYCTNQSPDLLWRSTLVWAQFNGPLSDLQNHCDPTPKLVVVQGDTRTAFEGAVWAYERGIPIFHVEAGVRTYDLSSPHPEEGYRQMISRVATYHACTTDHNADNLDYEWYGEGDIRMTGSPVVEAVRSAVGGAVVKTNTLLLTLHRRENQPHFAGILQGVEEAANHLKLHVIWPSHPNGWASKANTTSLSPIPPMDQQAFARALAGCQVLVTDSGGCQEEANALGVRAVVARTSTDRPESLGEGGAILGGVTKESVLEAILGASKEVSEIDTTIYGDGTASSQIAGWLEGIVEAKDG